MIKRRLLISLILLAITIPVGLFSRQVSWLPEETGDALWAMMVFCIWRVILCRKKLILIAIISLLHSYIVEFSQMIRWPWLVEFRSTFIGHMMLGQGFLWFDLVAYTMGIVLIYLIIRTIERMSKRKDIERITT